MPETNDRKFKILGAAWLGLGCLSLAYVFVNVFSLAQGDTPSATAVSDGYWVFFAGALLMGAIGMVNGLALLRRNRVARLVLAISSVVLLLPSLALIVPLLVVLPSLWLTLSKDGKDAYESYLAKGNGTVAFE